MWEIHQDEKVQGNNMKGKTKMKREIKKSKEQFQQFM